MAEQVFFVLILLVAFSDIHTLEDKSKLSFADMSWFIFFKQLQFEKNNF